MKSCYKLKRDEQSLLIIEIYQLHIFKERILYYKFVEMLRTYIYIFFFGKRGTVLNYCCVLRKPRSV